jgi:hypothetical protein
MKWNHRVIRFKDDDQEGGYRYEFAEVFYKDDGSLMGYANAFMFSETLDGLQELTDRLTEATTKPVLDEGEFHESDNA